MVSEKASSCCWLGQCLRFGGRTGGRMRAIPGQVALLWVTMGPKCCHSPVALEQQPTLMF